MASTFTATQLVSHITAYRALGTKLRRQYKRTASQQAVRRTLLAQDAIYVELCEAHEANLAMSLSVEQRRLNLLRDVEARGGSLGTMRLDVSEVRTRIRNIVADRKDVEALAAHTTEVIGLDITTATLNDLVAARRSATAVFRLQERPATEVIERAMSTLDLVDDELYLRTWIGFKLALIKESAALTIVESTERSGGTAAPHVVEELAELRRGIANHLSHYGTTTRQG